MSTFSAMTTQNDTELQSEQSTARLRSLVRIMQRRFTCTQELLDHVLDEAIALTESRIGYIYLYEDERRQFVLNSWSKDVMKACEIVNPQSCYELDKTGVWGEAVRQRKPIVLNHFSAPHPLKKGYPEGHAELHKFMTVPVFSNDRIVAVLGLANKASDYDDTDVLQVGLLMDSVWKTVEQLRAQDKLSRLEWMLRSRQEREERPWAHQPYGDLTELNTSRVILDSIGSEVLCDIVGDHLDLLDTSSVIYEANGDYAQGIFASGWCRRLDAASRNLCATSDNQEALACGKWLCHEACWNGSARLSIERGEPVDVPCPGGLRLRAVPIRAGDNIIGSISFGYGDPPRDQAELLRIAARYQVPAEELAAEAAAYESRPPFVVALAHKRLDASARLIGEIAARTLTQKRQAILEERLRTTERLESIGRLAGGIAHDFNNLLSVVLGNTELLLDDLPSGHHIRHRVEHIHAAADRAADLTRQILAFGRRQILRPELLDLAQVVEAMSSILPSLVGVNIEIRQHLSPNAGMVKVDRSQIEQVLLNLVVNARDAMPNGGRLTIEVTAQPRGCGELSGDCVVLRVSDTGVGMDQATQAQIFEPFFTTKPMGTGTGLGLSTAYGIVKQSGGEIAVHSEPGGGSCFEVFLPRFGETLRLSPSHVNARSVPGQGEIILVVEDESDVREITCSILRGAGYRVLEARDGEEALARISGSPGSVDLVLSDVIMPRMGGMELVNRLSALHPSTPTLFMSGYADDVIDAQGTPASRVELISKPLRPAVLTAKVRQVLDLKANKTGQGL
jgi:signal transduction histidine kinase/ActR/RegA family two-component response regulator